MKIAKLFLMAVGAVLLLTTFAAAAPQGVNPAYMSALERLREARNQLAVETRNSRVEGEQRRAIQEIDEAIDELQGRRIPAQPPVPGPLVDRLQSALALLDTARDNIGQAHDDDLKHRMMHHVDAASMAVHRALEAAMRP